MKHAVLALDVGEARIGLARADAHSGFAFGRGWLVRSTLAQDISEVTRVAAEEGANVIVIGLPRRSDGLDSTQTRRVRSFAADLKKSGLNVVLEDERFTTQLAARQISRSGLPRGKRQEKGLLDEAAAVLILENWLRRQQAERSANESGNGGW
jgi:putative Holliday junction resolvase